MWKVVAISLLIVTGLGNIAFAISGHLMEDQRRHVAYNYLLAGIGLTLLGMVLGAIELFRVSKPEKPAERQNPEPDNKFKFKFDAFWDSDLNPYCPIDKTPLTLSTKKLIYEIDPFNNSVPPPKPVLYCRTCDDNIILYDDDGDELTLGEAKQLLSPIKRKGEAEPPKLPKKKQDEFVPGHRLIRVLRYINNAGPHGRLADLALALAREPYEIQERIDVLVMHDYLRPDSSPISYRLTEKGKECLNEHDNNLRDSKPEPKEPEPETYEPDKTDTKILIQISQGNGYDAEIANALKLEVKQLAKSLKLLERHDYIRVYQLTNFAPYYQLTKKAAST